MCTLLDDFLQDATSKFFTRIPSIVAIKYLDATKHLTTKYRDECKKYLEAGFQKLSNFKNDDGSFNMYQPIYRKQTLYEPNIWLTAYIAKLLAQTKGFYALRSESGYTQDKLIVDALRYLKNAQLKDGNFTKQKVHFEPPNDPSETVALTAFVAIAFMENNEYLQSNKDNAEVVRKAMNYIHSKSSRIKNNYELAIATYAMTLNKHRSMKDFLSLLKRNAIQFNNDNSNNGMMYWNKEFSKTTTAKMDSINVEIAAYAVMALLNADEGFEAIPIMNWLMTQRTSKGGFYSSTDTAVGIQALAMMAERYHTEDTDLDLKFTYEKGKQTQIKINTNK